MILILKILLWLSIAIALISAIVFWKYYKYSLQRYFPHLLVLILVTEILSTTLKEFITGFNASPLYNILSIISIYFYLIWFFLILKKSNLIKIGIYIFSASIIFSIFKYSFLSEIYKTMWFTGAILILIASVIYYNILLKDDNLLYYKSNQTFWISSGLLIFYIGYLPLLLFFSYGYIKSNSLYYRIPVLLLNFALYGSFAKSFICSKNLKI